MKKYLLALGLVLIIGLCGCGNSKNIPTEPAYPIPTLPDFDQTLSPQQHLQSAIDALRGGQWTASWGSGWEKELTLTPGDGDALRQLIPNGDFVADFCAMGMMVVPSNDGTFRYEVRDLSVADICRLLCAREPTAAETDALGDYPEATGDICLTVDEARTLRSIQVDVHLNDAVWTLQIHFQ